MSFSTLLFVAACIGSYKLGALNQRRPGTVTRRLREIAQWLWKWMNQ